MATMRPLGDNVVLKAIPQPDKTASGIFLPESAKEKTKRGEVVFVGTGKFVDGHRQPLEVKVGDTVIYSWGDEITVEGEDYVLVSESNIQLVV